MIAKKIYIAGPMSGYDNLNFPRFYEIEDRLKAEGWDVVNPARLDEEVGIDPANPPTSDYNYTECALRDVRALLDCEAIYLMDGWQHSRGASWERALAKFHSIRRFYETPRLEDYANE